MLGLVTRNLWLAIHRLPSEGLLGREFAVLTSIVWAIWVVTGFTADLRFFEFMGMTVLLLIGIAVGASERAWEAQRNRPPAPLPDDEELIFGPRPVQG